MKVAIFSDIHGNLPAWLAAVDQMRSWKAEQHVFLGDLCGYYYNQLEIFDTLRRLPDLVAVRGNHDQMLIDILDGDTFLRSQYAQRYGSSMERLLGQDHAELAKWLRSLPLTAAVGDALCVHGDPGLPLEGYVYPDTEPTFQSKGRKVIILGHTHYRMSRSHLGTLLLNPGSLGQPRDGLLPSWAGWDTCSGEIRFADVRVDMTELLDQLKDSPEEPEYLSTVLQRMPETL